MQASETAKGLKAQWSSFEQPMLQRGDPPGAIDTIDYTVLHMIADSATPDRTTDAMVHNALGEQGSDGSWFLSGIARAPMEDSAVTSTAMALRILKVYGSKGMQQELDVRIRRAAAFLKNYTPRTTEERNMRLLGLHWAGDKVPAPEVKTLLRAQHADGGWSQTAHLGSDAYATATTLYALHELGTPASDAAYRRGAEYLLKTQLEDGSWHVKSRAPKFQPYFQSGFPYDHDQWISNAATAWATTALSYAIPP